MEAIKGTKMDSDESEVVGAARRAPGRLPPLIAEFYEEAPPTVRVRLLDSLLRPVGPLALVAIATGAFANLLPTMRWRGAQVSLDDVTRISASQVLELARYVEQKSPEILLQLLDLLDGSLLSAGLVSGTLLLIALRHRQRQG